MELTKSWQQYGSSSYKDSHVSNTLTFKYYIRYQDVTGNPLRKTIQMYASCTCPSPSYYRLSAGDNNACYHGVYTTLNGANQKGVTYTFKLPSAINYPLDDSDIPTYTVSWTVDYNSSTGKWSGTIASYHKLSYYSGSDISGCYTYSGNTRWGITNTSSTTSVPISLPDLVFYNVTVSADPSCGGTVSGGGSKASGSSVTVSATPNNFYEFVNWTNSGGTELSTNSSYTFTVSSATTLVAHFKSTVNAIRWGIVAGG